MTSPEGAKIRRLDALGVASDFGAPRAVNFDRLTRLAARLCGAPMAILRLADDAGLPLRSAVGIEPQGVSALPFCAWALEHRQTLILEDTAADPRFAMPATHPGAAADTLQPLARAYAGVPLLSPGGAALGTLAVADDVPRGFDELQLEALHALAEQVTAQIDLSRRHAELAHALAQRDAADVALRASEAHYRLMFEHNPQPMWVYDLETLRFLAVNEAAVLRYGYSAQEFLAMTIRDIRPPEDVEALLQDVARHQNTLSPAQQWRHLCKDGSLIEVDITAHSLPFDGRPARLVLAHDVTDRVDAQRRLLDSEARFRHVARATTDAIWDWDLQNDTVWWNEGLQTLFGFSPGEVEPGADSWTKRIHPDDLQRVLDDLHAVMEGDGETWTGEYRFARKQGGHAWVLDRAFLIRAADGSVPRMVGGMTDLTQQRESERRLRHQAALLDKATDAILVVGTDGRITAWNEGAERLYGWRAEEALGRVSTELFQHAPEFIGELREHLISHGEWSAAVAERCKDGRAVTVEGRWTLVRDELGAAHSVLAIKTDITERLELEARLRQSQRLEAVGHLTGGVAHDFNNLLTVILGNADLMAEQLADQPHLLPLAEMTRSAAQRGAELTHRLLAFARRQALQPQAVDANQLLASMDGLLRRALSGNIEIELVRGAGLWPALVDAAQLESAVLNLALNARDAMPDGGKLTLETANAAIDQDYADRHAEVQPGQYVLLSVSDTGSGIAPEHLAQVFEPFFTTKGPGKGSGLGLSMVYGFVKQSQGHIKLYSETGHGTTARLYLPRAGRDPTPHAVAPRSSESFTGSATILVVEDDELVRRFAQDQLVALGYRVIVASNGPQALQIIEQRDDIDLLFTDVVMPGGMTGRQLADAARQLRPALKVLYTSGYTENAIVHHGRLDRGVHLLNKPYRRIELARKVFTVLSAERT